MGGGGGFCKAKKKCIQLNWNFQRGGVSMFSGITHYHYHYPEKKRIKTVIWWSASHVKNLNVNLFMIQANLNKQLKSLVN